MGSKFDSRSFLIGAFSLGTLLASPAVNARSVATQDLINAIQDDHAPMSDVSAALMMIDLYDRGLAGGKTGLCVDFDQTDGRRTIKVGLNTSAFVTGKDGVKDTLLQADVQNLQKLVAILAKAEGGKVPASVSGYADGQHYQNEFTSKKSNAQAIEDSIHDNESLSLRRANRVADLLERITSDSGALQIGPEDRHGYASPELERNPLYSKASGGLNCPTRRKVVITLDAPDLKIKEVVSPTKQFVPDELSQDLKLAANRAFAKEIRGINTSISRGSMKDRAEQIYAELKKRNRLIPQCDQEPMKQLTLSFIAYSIDGKDRKNNIQDWIDRFVGRPFKAHRPDNDAMGIGTLSFGCVRPSDDWMQAMLERHPDFETSAKDFFRISGRSNVTGTATVSFDPSLLHEEKIMHGKYAGPPVKDGRHKGTFQVGYFCKACGSGLYFLRDDQGNILKDKDGNPRVDYVDRAVDSVDPNRSPADVLNSVADADPFSFAGFMKPRLYLVKNCKGLSTAEIIKRIESKDPSVSSVDPLESRSQLKVDSAVLEHACVIRPPLLHTCSATQNHQEPAEEAQVSRSFEYPDLSGVSRTASSISELINHPSQTCGDRPILSPQEKINQVSCVATPNRRLPSEHELQDCPDPHRGSLKGI